METKDNFPMHTIKKIKRITHQSGASFGVEKRVNTLLSKGWVLLALEVLEVSPREQRVIFTMGHTDPSADDTIEYTSP